MKNLSKKLGPSTLGDGQIRIMHLQQSDREPHHHTFFELVYVVRGSATHYLEENALPLRAGDYFIIDPGSRHCYRNTRNLEIINCLFLPEYIDRALTDCPSLTSLLSNQILRFGVPVNVHAADRIFHDNDKTVGKLIRQMEQEYHTAAVGYMELLRCHLTHILVHAVRATADLSQRHMQHSVTAQVADHLQQNYARPLSLNAISTHLGYTPQYLSALFHKDTGMTLQVFLQRLRVEEACRLLEQKNMRLSAVAQAVGYNDAKHFSKVFRQHKGLSPREYRSHLF